MLRIAVGCLVAGILAAGCMGPDQNVKYVTESVIKPTIEKAVSETRTQTASFQGSLQGIRPGYSVHVQGGMFTGFIGDVTVSLDGVAGQISGATQAVGTRPAETPAPSVVGSSTKVITNP